jgi:hypothetical protein
MKIALAAAVGVVVFAATAGACATAPASTDAAALIAYANAPWDKAALAHSTIEVGRLRGTPVVADFPCADVCPQYTVRIIHYRLPPGASCASVGGVEKDVLVPVAITVMSRKFCIPEPLVASGKYFSR